MLIFLLLQKHRKQPGYGFISSLYATFIINIAQLYKNTSMCMFLIQAKFVQ